MKQPSHFRLELGDPGTTVTDDMCAAFIARTKGNGAPYFAAFGRRGARGLPHRVKKALAASNRTLILAVLHSTNPNPAG